MKSTQNIFRIQPILISWISPVMAQEITILHKDYCSSLFIVLFSLNCSSLQSTLITEVKGIEHLPPYLPCLGPQIPPPSPKLTSGSDQIRLVTQLCPTLCDPMNHSMPGLLVHHQLPEFTQTQVHRVSDAIQPSHPLSSPCLPDPNPSQNQSLFQ